MGIKAHVICHTHWDREWYFTREQFRTKLIRLIDGLLELVETVPEYVSFMLDGQTILLDNLPDGPTKQYAVRVKRDFAIYRRLYYDALEDDA